MATFAPHPSPFDFPLFAEYPPSSHAPHAPGAPMDGNFDQSMALFDTTAFPEYFSNQFDGNTAQGFYHKQHSYGQSSVNHANQHYGGVSSASTGSAESSSSSALTSPSANQSIVQVSESWDTTGTLDLATLDNSNFDLNTLLAGEKYTHFVDPSLIQPLPTPTASTPSNFSQPQHQQHQQQQTTPTFQQPQFPQPPSPAFSNHSVQASNRLKSSRSQSPYMHSAQWQPYTAKEDSRRGSIHSISSRYSHPSPRSGSTELDEEGREKQRCPFPECGRMFKDLKAHMLTHQNERPEKCPIVSCEYHSKGFARKYDKNRHTLTHYKGLMVCGFCPGSGSSAEKSFNRADVFKRHLTTVHGVEQNPPNGRKKSPTSTTVKRSMNHAQDATGKCSTCGSTFATAQDLYEHLDDCVLRVVQQEDPSEAINKQLLSSVADDEDVKNTMDRHMLSESFDNYSFNEEDEDEEEEASGAEAESTAGSRSTKSGKGSIKSRKDDPS